jgi:hypothetical protein
MKDIQIIGSDFQRYSFSLLPESFDRLRSCHYFCEETQNYTTQENDKMAKWYFRAAMSSFQSTLDTIDGDVKRKLGKNYWKESDQRKLMYSDSLVKILSKLRNFTVHTTRLSGAAKDYFVTKIDGNGSRVIEIRSLFFDALGKNKNIKGISSVSEEEVQWFNKQSETWPADLLIREGLYQASTYVHHFCAQNKIV